MAASVSAQRAKQASVKKERKQKSQKTLSEQNALTEKNKKEAEAISVTEDNTSKIRNQVSEKMIGMCKKKWAEGEHRCYCEPYLEFAPAGIESDASCSGG